MRLALLIPFILAVSCQTITEPDITEPTDPEPNRGRMSVVGYHTWWSQDAWRQYDFQSLDALYFFALEIGADGAIADRHGWPEAWQDLVSTARATGTAVIPSVTILDTDTYRSVFGDSTAVDTLLAELTRLAGDVAADGVHLDFEMFESVTPGMRSATTDLVRRLRDSLDTGSAITMFTLAEDHAEALDEAALAPYLDKLIVQAYDMHWQTGDTAGPVAPLAGWAGRNWQTILNRYQVMGIEPQKMLFTVPYYGYEWPTTDYHPGAPTTGVATVLAYGNAADGIPSARDRAELHGKLRDELSGSPYYAYRDTLGQWYQGWFEDSQSIMDKYAFVAEHGLGGVAIFPLAYGDPDLVAALASARMGQFATVAP